MLKLLKIGLPAVLLVGGLVAFQMMQPKGPLDIHTATTEVTINASGLYAAFESDEEAANATYAGKVIEVSGSLNSIDKSEDGGFQVKLTTDSPLGSVLCNLAPGEASPANAAVIGGPVSVKGVCTGYLFDVVVDNATIMAR